VPVWFLSARNEVGFHDTLELVGFLSTPIEVGVPSTLDRVGYPYVPIMVGYLSTQLFLQLEQVGLLF